MAYERRLGQAKTGSLTIPIGGGRAEASITLSDLGFDSKTEYVIDVRVERLAPIVNDVYEPSYGISDNTVGLTLFAGTGTTLRADVLALGY